MSCKPNASGSIKFFAGLFPKVSILVGAFAVWMICWGNSTEADEVKAPLPDQVEKAKQTSPKDKQKETSEKSDPKDFPKIDKDRINRKNRWVMNFSTFDGKDYANQLKDLGAIIAVPITGDKMEYLLINDLADPKKRETVKDLTNLNRIWWTDDYERSVKELSKTLKIDPVPKLIIAFFPKDLEDQLSEMELNYAKKNGMKTVEDISETTFQVKRGKSKNYEPIVHEQKYKE